MKFLSFIDMKIFFLLLIIHQIAAFAANENYEEGKVYRHQLKNGLTVLTMERHIAPLIYHQLTYKVGSRNEHLGITGISHVVEHMMFKGTEKYGKGIASKTISKNAGIFNAFTSNDMTSYFEYLPANKIEIAMEIESDRMQNCLFNPEEFKSEIQVIIQERRMRSESQANGIFHEELNSVAYTSHQNRDPVIGWPSDLQNMTRDDAYKYYKTYYTPNNAFLVLVGDFQTDDILKKVEKYYGNISPGPEVKDYVTTEEIQKTKRTLTLYHSDITSPSIRFSFHVPTYNHTDANALKMAGMILCERSRDARLYKRLVEKERIAQSVAGGMGISKDPGLFSISCTLKPDSSIDKVEKILWEEINKMQNELVSDHELQKIKNRYKFNQVTNYTKNADIGSRMSSYEAYFGYDFFKEFDTRMFSVSKEDIQRVMKKYFNETQVTIGYMFPKEGNKKTNLKDIESEIEEKTNLTDDKFFFIHPLEALDILNKTLVDEEILKPKPIAPSVKKMKLDNGVTLYTLENHLVPAVSVIGLFETGLIPEDIEGGKPGITGFLTDLMNRGTIDLTYENLSERMAFVPFSFAMSGSYKAFYFQGYSLNENADEMFKTGYDIVTNPGFRDEDINKLKPQHIITAKNRFKRTGIKAFYYMFDQIFEGHPLTQYNSTEESIKSITKQDLINLHKKYIRPNDLTLLMVGDMTPEQMKELANKYFGNWKLSSDKFDKKDLPKVKELNKKEIKVFTEKDYTECTINIGFSPYNDYNPEDEDAISIMNYILAGSSLTSRMGVELRDKQGLIYGIKSEIWDKVNNIAYWKFNTKTGPQNTKKVIKGIFTEIKKFFETGVTDDEIKTAKQRMFGLLPFYAETPDDVAGIVFGFLQDKKPLDFFDKKADRIMKVTKEDVLRVAKKYFTLDRFIIVVDGPIEQKDLEGFVEEL
jgi:zinc protease